MGLLHERNNLSQQLSKLLVALASVAEHALRILQLFVLWEIEVHLDQVAIYDAVEDVASC